MFERQITERFLKTLSHIEYGAITVTTPDGKMYTYQGKNPGVHADMVLHDWRAIVAFARDGDTGLAEAYRDGWWDSRALTDVFYFGLQNEQALNGYLYGSWLGRASARFAYLFTQNSLKGSRKNIHAHYDLGNEFYRLWLDPTMTYSSAIFESKEENLVPAQHRKYDRIIERLDHSGKVLEIGCGWGGFAERALTSRDYAITGLTISGAQHAYAKQRLKDKAHIVLQDYRNQAGKFNSIVSIEMFEAVGEKYWPVYFRKLKSLLENNGKAMIQTITIRDDYFDAYRRGGDAIRTFIFPGGMLPSYSRFKEESKKAGLKITDRFAFGQDYARTLEHWLTRFEACLPDVKSLGFDEKFIRLWRFYLTCCIASFKVGRTDVMQVELKHAA